MRRTWRGLPSRLRRDDPEHGRIIVLVAGLFALLGMLIIGGIDVTSVLLARMHVLDAADAAAVHAADSIDRARLYHEGIGQTIRLSDASVRAAAGESLRAQRLPAHVAQWGLSAGTGTDDGATAVVRVTAHVQPPLLGGLMSFLDHDVTVTVESHARATIDAAG